MRKIPPGAAGDRADRAARPRAGPRRRRHPRRRLGRGVHRADPPRGRRAAPRRERLQGAASYPRRDDRASAGESRCRTAPSRPTGCSSRACRRPRAPTTRWSAASCSSRKPLVKERLGFFRWTAMFLALFGSYGKNDTVDVQYRSAAAHGGNGTRDHPAGDDGLSLPRHADRRDPRRAAPRVLVRVLPAEDRRGPREPARDARGARGRTSPTSCRSPTARSAPRATARSRSSSGSSRTSASRRWPTSRASAPRARSCADTLERDRGRRRRERARAARRPAPGRDRVDQDRGRPRVLDRADRAPHGATSTSRSAPPRSPRSTPRPQSPRERHRVPQGEAGRRREVPHHAALLRQRVLLRLRRACARGGHHGADHPRRHAGDELPPDQAHHRPLRVGDPRGARARARVARGRPRGTRRARRRLRDLAVRRPARPRRARHPLLHAQPLTRDPRHLRRAAGRAAVDPGAAQPV